MTESDDTTAMVRVYCSTWASYHSESKSTPTTPAMLPEESKTGQKAL